MVQKDPYKVLGIDKQANEEDIKKAYRLMAKKFHPDKNDSHDAEEKFKEIGSAYETLKDPVKKFTHDNATAAAAETSARKASENEKNQSKPSPSGPSFFKPETKSNENGFSFSSSGPGFKYKSSTFSTFADGAKRDKKKDETKDKSQSQSSSHSYFKPKQSRASRPTWNDHWTEDYDDNTIPNTFRFAHNVNDPFEDLQSLFNEFNQGKFVSGTFRDFLRISPDKRKARPKAAADIWDWSNPVFGKQNDIFEDDLTNDSDPEVDNIFGSNLPCSYCGRLFKAADVTKHEEICRRIFGGRKKSEATDFPTRKSNAQRKQKEYSDEDDDDGLSPPPRSHDWRQEHEELLRNLRNKRKMYAQKSARSSRDASDFVKCKWCYRKFSAAVAERHIPSCEERIRLSGQSAGGSQRARDDSSSSYRSRQYTKRQDTNNATHQPNRTTFRDVPCGSQEKMTPETSTHSNRSDKQQHRTAFTGTGRTASSSKSGHKK